MNYFFIEPEVAGGLGSNTILDRTTHPPRAERLHYEFEGWLGDALLEGFPCLIATEQASNALKSARATGVDYAEVEVSTSQLFRHLYPNRQLPPFVWLQIKGTAGKDDFGRHRDMRAERPRNKFVISERALEILRPFGLNHADIEPYS